MKERDVYLSKLGEHLHHNTRVVLSVSLALRASSPECAHSIGEPLRKQVRYGFTRSRTVSLARFHHVFAKEIPAQRYSVPSNEDALVLPLSFRRFGQNSCALLHDPGTSG